MRAFFLVFLGGGLGSALRWVAGLWALKAFGPGFPVGTLLVNAVGCFAMGVLFRWLPAPDAGGSDARLLLMTGILGGFTTFSAFALDAAGLWLRQDHMASVIYIALTLLSTLAGVMLGLFAGRWVAA